jgi:hypothetical protein
MVCRQRQYFKQKKRRQQQQNQNDVAGGQASYDKEHRSLDVLNINNLAIPSSHHNEPAGQFPIYVRLMSQRATLFSVFNSFILLAESP